MISVIIPLYNKEDIIERSLKSVLSQNYDDFEVVIVDDGSTDKGVEIVRSITDDRVHFYSQENGGPSKARNTGVKYAKGEWIIFLDADDELLPDTIKNFAHKIELHKDASLIASPYYKKYGTNKVLMYPYEERYVSNPFKEHFFGSFFIRTGNFACKRELLLLQPFNNSIRRFEDFETWFRIFHIAKIFLCSLPSMILNVEFVSASCRCKDISEDFLGHLNFKRKSFWERLCLYQLFLWERSNYPEQCKKLYPSLYKRWDLYFLYQILTRTKRIWT